MERTSERIEILPFEPRKAEAGTRLAANALWQSAENGMPFELGIPAEKPLIPSKKPTVENDDGLVRKDSRDDRI